MRKFSNIILGVFVITLLASLTACNKDDGKSSINPTTSERLIGTWTISDYDFDITIGDRTMVDYLIDVEGLPPSEAEEIYAYFLAFMESEVNGTLTLKSDHTYVSNFAGEPTFGTWSLSPDEKTLILTEGDDTILISIISISATTWNASISESSPEDLDDNPETPDVVVSVEIQITLTK